MRVGGHGAHEDAWVARDMVHAQAVAEDGAAGERGAGVQCKYGHTVICGKALAEQGTYQRALAGAGRASDADGVATPAMPSKRSVQFAGCRRLALQQGDSASQGRPVAIGDAGSKLCRTTLGGCRAQSADRRKSISESALGTGRGLVPHQMSWKM